MSGAADCREIRHALGVYVLGAIDPVDRSLVDQHLAGCPDCREELASLAGLPALLRRVPAAEAERLAADSAEHLLEDSAPDDLLPAVLARTTHVRRVRRWRELAVAAAVTVLALGAGAAGANMLHGSAAPGHRHVAQSGGSALAGRHAWQTVSETSAMTGVTLTVKYRPMPWGTTMTAQVGGIRSGTVCQFWVTDSSGHRRLVGGWRVEYQGGPMWYPASTSLTDSNLRSFEVTAGGKVVATVHAP
ncbi:MAG TPA: zf-HC2 domain-containing protein [Streptosporangiaceae bacterium]|nr:zf-HC2 domain-containing protein [Streptosporangiaceae bacterium]